MKIGYKDNQYGTLVSVHKCDTCGKEFTVCPAVPDDKDDQWTSCLAVECSSYDETRDIDRLWDSGIPIECGPVLPLNHKDNQ